jgi:hypothetical protein
MEKRSAQDSGAMHDSLQWAQQDQRRRLLVAEPSGGPWRQNINMDMLGEREKTEMKMASGVVISDTNMGFTTNNMC